MSPFIWFRLLVRLLAHYLPSFMILQLTIHMANCCPRPDVRLQLRGSLGLNLPEHIWARPAQQPSELVDPGGCHLAATPLTVILKHQVPWFTSFNDSHAHTVSFTHKLEQVARSRLSTRLPSSFRKPASPGHERHKLYLLRAKETQECELSYTRYVNVSFLCLNYKLCMQLSVQGDCRGDQMSRLGSWK